VRTRIISLAVLTSVVATVLFAVPLGVAVLQYALQHQWGHLVRHASDLAITVAGDVYHDDRIDPEVLDDVDDDGGAVAAAVFDRDGQRLAGAVRDDDTDVLAEAFGGEVSTATDGILLVVAVPVTHSDEVIGAVEVTQSRADVLGAVGLMWAGMAGLATAAVTVAWLIGRRQARRLAQPLEELEESARRLGEGDFSIRTRRGGIEETDAVGAALEATAARLDDLLARERAFSTDASHQLRTPLAGMRLRLEAALERTDVDPRPAIAASLVDADRLAAIIDEVLALARAGQGPPAGPVDLDTLAGELSPEWRARLDLHGRDLEVRVDPGAPEARASTAAVRQVLGVLVDNACTHGRGTVTVTVREATGAVAVDVADEGEGPGVQGETGAVFTPRAERRDGHGIGLPLARRLAEAEHGRLQLTRVAPPVFTLLLPAVPVEARHEHEVAAAGSYDR
jgi:signal transduction histidine kinase